MGVSSPPGVAESSLSMLGGVLVLAAGKSTRISPLSSGLPKPLIEFGGRRLIEWSLGWLVDHGVERVSVNLHYRPGVVRSTLGDGSRYGLRIDYLEEPELLGTAGAWRNAALSGWWGETSLVVYGDNVMRFDLGALRSAHEENRRRGALATIAVYDPSLHLNTGIAGGHLTLDEDRVIERFEEGTPPSGEGEYVNTGVYLLEPELLEVIPPGFQDFGRDIFPTLLAGHRIYGHIIEAEGYCLGLDTPESFQEGERILSEGELKLG